MIDTQYIYTTYMIYTQLNIILTYQWFPEQTKPKQGRMMQWTTFVSYHPSQYHHFDLYIQYTIYGI